ncbi:hypothetical protein ACP70R_002262 [Stipagrostis hirtigluma subsp. patula]
MESTVQVYRIPLLEDDNSQEVCFFCSYLAYSSITKNLVSYLKEVLHETNVVAARNVSTWQGTCYLTPLVGAFLADSYLGKYWTSLIFCTIFIIGMVMLILSAALPLISTSSHVWLAWTDTVSYQHIIVFVGLYMVAIGYGGQNPCLTSFGADQFDHTDEEERNRRSTFFNWRYFILNAASLVSGTIIVWVQDHEGWLLGFTIPALFVALGGATLLLGSTLYRIQKPRGSPVARVCQVLVAAARNFNKDLPSDCSLLYELPEQGSSIGGTRKLDHTTGLE